ILRGRSSDLFKNSLVLPAAWSLTQTIEIDATVAASDIRRELGGQVENNQIREALERLEKVGALRKLPHAGRPNPHVWVRQTHPFWGFVETWVEILTKDDARQ
ncbi:MAG: hypothetical protein J0H06_07730, partial [Actinobacteria bacterium]|nr:hypothetical protein [Actinomycetota bacterium]